MVESPGILLRNVYRSDTNNTVLQRRKRDRVLCLNSSLLGPLGLELPLQRLHSLVQLRNRPLELLIVGLELVGIALLRGAEAALNEIDCVLGLFGLLVKADEDLG